MKKLIRNSDNTWTLYSTEEDMIVSLNLYLSKYTFKHKKNKLVFLNKSAAFSCYNFICNSTSLREWGYEFTLKNKIIHYKIVELQSMTFTDPVDQLK